MTAETRNILIFGAVLAALVIAGVGWLEYLSQQREAVRRERQEAFDRRCKLQGGATLLGCSEYCVKWGSVLEYQR